MQALEAKSSLVNQKIQATAIKMVQEEAVKQLWVRRVLDRYSRLFQVGTLLLSLILAPALPLWSWT